MPILVEINDNMYSLTLRLYNYISLIMEVTDLKGLKRLMRGDASGKFEFVEDEADHGQFDDMMFSYHGDGQGKSDNPGATYNTYNPAKSASAGGKYRDLSSDDSELMDQEQPGGERKSLYEDDDYNEKTLEDMMYDAPTT